MGLALSISPADDNTYSGIAVGDGGDKFADAVIGDEKVPDRFEPRLKVKRFDEHISVIPTRGGNGHLTDKEAEQLAKEMLSKLDI